MRLFFLFLLLAGFTTLQAQTISGTAKDDQGAPVADATVSLVKAKDTAVVKFTISKADGAYSFAGINDGQYRVSVSHVGYKPFVSAPFAVAGTDVTVPVFALARSAGDLKAVTVSYQKPVIEVKADKTILNVEGTI